MSVKTSNVGLIRLVLILLLLILAAVSISIGVRQFSLLSLLQGSNEAVNLALISRIPRTLSIIVTGMSMSLAGQIMQTVTNNRFVSPTTAGTMEWCRMGVLFAIVFMGGQSSLMRMLMAFAFSLFGTFFFLRLMDKVRYKNAILVPLIGMMLGSVIRAITTFFAYRLEVTQNMSSWMQGDFSLVTRGRYELLFLGIPFLILAVVYARRFTLAGLGANIATNLGLNHKQTVSIGLTIVAVITSTVLVTVGSVPFLGLIIPNLISIFRGDNLKSTMLDTMLFGSIFLLISDIIGRIIIYPYEIPVSVIVSVLGSFVFLFLVFRRRQANV